MAPVVSRRPWEAGEEHKERRTDGRKVLGQVVVVGGEGGVWAVGCSHAVTEAGLWRLGVAWCCCVTVAVGLLRRHGHIGPCCEHELGCAVNNGLRLCSLLLLFPQGLGGFKFVHLVENKTAAAA